MFIYSLILFYSVMRKNLLDLLSEIKYGKKLTDEEISDALRQLKEKFVEVSHEIFSNDFIIPLREIIRRGILTADDDLFLACEEHDSLRREAYHVVRSMSLVELEEASIEILAKNLERTLLGSFIMRRIG